MELTQAFAQKLKLFDAATLGSLKKLADDYDRSYPIVQTPQAFSTSVTVFLRQRLPNSSEVQKFARGYIAFHRATQWKQPGLGVNAAAQGRGAPNDMNLYYLQMQEALSAANREYSMLSTILRQQSNMQSAILQNIR